MSETTATPSALRAFLDDANARHADDAAAIATALLARGPTLPADAEGAEALRLAEHVMLGHLGDAASLSALVAAWPAVRAENEATAPTLQRVRWALAMVQDPPGAALPPAPPDAPRWRALQNVVLALAATGRCSEAAALLAADEAAAQAHGTAEAGVAYAATANNVAGHLQTGGARGDAACTALMLQAATIARRAWGRAGNWMHAERAEYRLALCHALAGNGDAAVHHARLCLAGCMAAGDAADAVEHFFAHEALARGHRAAGDAGAAAAAVQQMRTLLAQIGEADGLRSWCARTLADLPG